MKAKLFQNKLCVQKSLIHGYGVFAQQDIQADEIVEECLGIIYEFNTPEFINYAFRVEGQNILLLGFGSIYNHADDPNICHEYDIENRIMFLKAKRLIRKGEEIFISYGKNWFSERKIFPKKVSFLRRFRAQIFSPFAKIGIIFGSISSLFLLVVYFLKGHF